ncbi:MAG: outer membrane beta-barrel protein [bacterium]
MEQPSSKIPTNRSDTQLMKNSSPVYVLFLAGVAACLSAAPVEARWSLKPRVYAEAQYDDNILLSAENEQDDLITTVAPGLSLAHESPTDEVNLDYQFLHSFFRENSELDYSGHIGRLRAHKDFGRLGFDLAEVFLRSENPVELTGLVTFERPSLRRGERFRYTRNIVAPELRFRFGEGRSVRLYYRNNLLRNQAGDVADQDAHAYGAALAFRINIRNRFDLSYERADRDYGEIVPPQPSRDSEGDIGRIRYTHAFDPRIAVFTEYRYDGRDFERETPGFFDYTTHDPRLGVTYELDDRTRLSASAGYAVREAEEGRDQETFSGRVDLTGQRGRLELEAYGETGFDEDFVSAELLGFYEFWRAGLRATFPLLERLSLEGYFYFERDEFDDMDRRDRILSGRATLSYQLLRWLSVSLHYQRIERSSDVSSEEFEDNRALARVTVEHDFLQEAP